MNGDDAEKMNLRNRIEVLEAERDEIALTLANSQAHNLDLRDTFECQCARAAAVSLDLDECRRELDKARELRAHIVRQFDENLDAGLRLAEKLEAAEKRIAELEGRA